jgi:hypothetical protein
MSTGTTAAVQTHGQSRKSNTTYKPLHVPNTISDVSTKDIIEDQQTDPTLEKLSNLAVKNADTCYNDGGKTMICVHKILYREFNCRKISNGKTFHQLIMSKKYRNLTMKLAYETLMAGHQVVKMTTDRVTSEIYWPGIQADIKRFCKSCDICQRNIPKGRIASVRLGRMPIITEHFKRVAVDIARPFEPRTIKGNKYILTIIDFATRYPEAASLPRI